MRDQLLKQAIRIVIKIGSSLLASRDTGLRPEQIDRLADEIAALAGELGIDCRYCHNTVDKSPSASIPPTSALPGSCTSRR